MEHIGHLIIAASVGAAVAVLVMLIATDRDRRHAKRLRSAIALARYQNDAMQGAYGGNGRGPHGQDWCDLYDELQPHEED